MSCGCVYTAYRPTYAIPIPTYTSLIHTNSFTRHIHIHLYTYIQVHAQDKASGKSQKITITSDKGRLSDADIERMVREAEENAELDAKLKGKVEAKNTLESYLYNLRITIDDTLKDKIESNDKEKLSTLITEALSWLDEHPNEDKESYDEKRKEIETVANPIITKIYQSTSSSTSTASDSSGAKGGSEDAGPSVEEVD